MTLNGSAAHPTTTSMGATIAGYVAILVVTLGATFITMGAALAENSPRESAAHTAITASVVAAIIVAAIAAAALPQTKSPTNYWPLLPALVACVGLALVVALLAYQGTADAIDYWQGPTPTGDAGNGEWRLAALIALASPYFAAALTAVRAGAARIFLVSAALSSFAWLAMTAFDQVARTNL